ncbi:YXWGXW repeat-containing protein [Variovorax sp. PAMC26660]|uniref:YXWGXW repeat-containing protein n=1 Tax=Variovorax sp. PAMC26660 TaxID=2762322 RepID=UPI00164DF66D|nr:YXWGXW repeat-containing protein [Variovorax sp. PAMC26660]QNK67159.1 YXWGXW repeat-containing protein [Variovorax sp. PAMC26660]
MRITNILLAATLAASALPVLAQVSVNINVPGIVQLPPPAPRYESLPRPRPGQVWVPGYWQWNERAYAWHPGYFVAARPNYAYAPGEWVRDDGGWRWREGNWRRAERRERREHDRYDDHDGDGDRPGGHHCPPGQAKKGRC